MEGSSAFHFGRAAYKAGMLSRGDIIRSAWANIKFRLNGSTDEGTEALMARILEMIRGRSRRELARLGPDVLASILPLVYPQMLELAWSHQDAGRPAYIVTAASNELAQTLAMVLQLDGGIGFRSELEDGVYTGRPAGPLTYREGKAQAIRELAEREDIDLAASYAYSDSESDLPMLRAVGNPVVVNPDRELQRVARSEGWQVMRCEGGSWWARRYWHSPGPPRAPVLSCPREPAARVACRYCAANPASVNVDPARRAYPARVPRVACHGRSIGRIAANSEPGGVRRAACGAAKRGALRRAPGAGAGPALDRHRAAVVGGTGAAREAHTPAR
jgi:HAD superfamily hydrolase (TIGR01490 family)